MNTMIIVGSFKNVPATLDEAAAIDGCGCFGIFFHIDLPLIKSAVITCLIVCFLGCWNEYPLTSIIINSEKLQTVALAASKFRGLYSTDYASMAAGLVILSVPQIVFFSFFQKYIVEGMCSGAVKA
jgi:raffinose/stachyose/melibiose transport system permease protein